MGWLIAALCVSNVVVASLVGTLWRSNLRLRDRLRRRDRSLARSLALVDMAEELAEFGRWRATPDGTPEWSRGLCRLTGFPPGMTPDFETQCEMMPDGGAAFYAALDENRGQRAPFAFEFAASRFDGQERTLRVVMRNEFDELTGRLVERQGVALDVTDSHRRFSEIDRERNKAMAIAEEAVRLAETDPLTGVANRRKGMAEADRGVLAASRDGRSFALVVFDIDHFKSVNDRYGHPAGDAVLTRVSELAKATIRERDLIARIGGEEFLCVLPGADLATARTCADRLRTVIARESAVDVGSPGTELEFAL